MEKIHFGNEIQRIMKQRNVSAAELAKILHLHVHSVYDMLKRDNIDVHRLMELSDILNYDFFQLVRPSSSSMPTWCNITFDNGKIVIENKPS